MMMAAAADFISRLTDFVLIRIMLYMMMAAMAVSIVSLLLPPRAGALTAEEEEENADLISELPDCVLGSIVSLLPPKAGARTAVLSRRWRHIWQSVPVDLDLAARGTDLTNVTARKICVVLSSRRGPIRSFTADLRGRQTEEAYDVWVQALAEFSRTSHSIQDSLVLGFPVGWGFPTYFPTVPLYRLAHSLRRLELHVCRLEIADDDDQDQLLLLPRLWSLHLSNVQVSDDTALQRTLDGCTALRHLNLFRIHGVRRLVLRSRTLTTLSIMPHVPLEELSFKDAPKLESVDFMHTDLWRKPDIAQAAAAHPNLGHVTLRMPPLYRFTADSIHKRRALSIVTVLELSMQFAHSWCHGDAEELMKAASMLTLFPCLHSLQILCLNQHLNLSSSKDEEADVGVWQWQQPDTETINSLNLNTNIKKVQIHGFIGNEGEVEFARFLVAKAKLLQAMEVFYLIAWSKKNIDFQRNGICTSGKLSSGAQIYFSKSNYCSYDRAKASCMKKVCLI